MADIQIENPASFKHVDQILPGSSPSFDDDEIYVDETEEVPEKSKSARSEKTLSTEDDEAQEAQSKGLLPSDTTELTPNTSSTSKSLKENALPIIDLTGVEEGTKETKREEAEQRKDLENNEHKTKGTKPLEPEKANEEKHKAKRKSKRGSSSKRASSKTRKPKKSAQNPKEETDCKEKSAKKKLSKKKSTKKVAPTSSVKPAGEPSHPISKTESPVPPKTEVPPEQVPITPTKQEKDTKQSSPKNKGGSPDDFKKRKDEKEKRADELRDYLVTVGDTLIVKPTTPTKQEKDIKKSSPDNKGSKGSTPDDFKKRKEAKSKRADELRNYLGTVGDNIMVEPRSDDSVSFLTMPQAIQGDCDHHVDLNKLPKNQVPPIRTVNPMISMGDDGENEPERRISYDLEALMSHQVPSKSKQHKWENVSVITDDIETVLGENENADIISLQSNGIKFGHDSRETEFSDIDLEQPSKEAATAVDCKTLSRTNFETILEDLQNLMIRRPISASVLFVFLVATLVFLGMALMQ